MLQPDASLADLELVMTAISGVLATDAAHFEAIYAEAEGDPSRIPWADLRPHPALVTWLNAIAPSIVRCGSRVAVVGCGLGDDARELMKRGYDVTAFDCSISAVDMARGFDPARADCYVSADLFDLPQRWRHRFDLVVEINTLQSLLPEMQAEAMKQISQLITPRGHLLLICRGAERPANVDDGPPWAISESQLSKMAREAGLTCEGGISAFMDDEQPPKRRMRAMFRRA